MKPKLRDYLTILMALLAIFLCGYGVGFLLGEKKGLNQSAPLTLVGRSSEDASSWEKSTLQRISESLKLTDEQQNLVSNEVQITSEKIQLSRDQAFEDYYLHLLELHERLLPHLNEEQQEKIKKDQKSLQRAINSRF
jgi:selenocysteine lyase/cysteine desulfurase